MASNDKRKRGTAEVRARAQAKREEARKAERARKLRLYFAGGGITAVVIAVVLILIISQASSGSKSQTNLDQAAGSVTTQLASIPASTYDAASATSAEGTFKAVSKPTLLTSGGKPVIIYVGAEFCPFCAAERWALVAALDRFGTFTGLQTTASSSSDTYPNTPTLTFVDAKYTSQYLVFDSTETEDRSENALQTLSGVSKTAFGLYDAPPYVASADTGSIPFLDVANTYVSSGAQYTPSTLSSLTSAEVATDLSNSTSKVSTAVLSSANVITAAICKVLPTADQPAGVCTSQGVVAGTTALTAGTSSGSSS